MKYHPLYNEHSHDRNFIGKHWNRKWVRAVQAVLNATKGSIGRGSHYFYRAFGKDIQEFHKILDMPDTFIIYRFFFEWLKTKDHPLSTDQWEKSVSALSEQELKIFHSVIYDENFTTPDFSKDYGEKINKALKFYANLRDAVQNPNGSLYNLKKEYERGISEDKQ